MSAAACSTGVTTSLYKLLPRQIQQLLLRRTMWQSITLTLSHITLEETKTRLTIDGIWLMAG